MPTDPILARILAEPGVREMSFREESPQRNFFLDDGPRRLEIHYEPTWRIVCAGCAREPEFLVDRIDPDRSALLGALETALGWLRGPGHAA